LRSMKSAATIVSCSRNVVAPCFFCTSRYDRNGVQKAMNAECKHKKKLPDIAAESHGWYMTFREELFLSRNEFEKVHLTANLDSCRRDTSALSAVRRAHDSAVVGFAPQQLLCSRRSGELSARAMQLMTLAFPCYGSVSSIVCRDSHRSQSTAAKASKFSPPAGEPRSTVSIAAHRLAET